jgi:hypothetical protein
MQHRLQQKKLSCANLSHFETPASFSISDLCHESRSSLEGSKIRPHDTCTSHRVSGTPTYVSPTKNASACRHVCIGSNEKGKRARRCYSRPRITSQRSCVRGAHIVLPATVAKALRTRSSGYAPSYSMDPGLQSRNEATSLGTS